MSPLSTFGRAGAAIAFALLAWLPGQQPTAPVPPLAALEPTQPVASAALADLDGDGRAELVVAFADGRLTSYTIGTDGAWQPRHTVLLPDPAHTLWATADLAPAAGVEVVVVDGRGASYVRWPTAARDAAVAEAPAADLQPLVRRARNTIRVDRPTLAGFVDDLNRDGLADLLVPAAGGVQPFLQEPTEAGQEPRFRALPVLPARAQVEVAGQGAGAELQSTLRIAQVTTADLDGDGRPDLLTRDGNRRGFHLQQADGTFGAPIELQLDEFEDSTPKAAVAPGQTIVLGDRQMLQRGDVDGDGIPDFVIAHRRKVWTFLAGKQGPQFTKAKVQAVAEDVSAFLVVDLDDDGKADLLTFQVQLPGVAALLLGLVQSIDIDIRAVGYRSEAGAFAGAPHWRRTLTLRIPPLLSLLGKQEELLQKFTSVVSKARLGVRGAFTAAGRRDLVLLAADARSVELHPRATDGPTLSSAGGRRLMRKLLFEDPNPLFDLDRILGVVSGLLEERAGELVGDAAPVATLPLRDPAAWQVVDLLVGDCAGDGRDALLVVYERQATGERPADQLPLRAFDLLRWPGTGN